MMKELPVWMTDFWDRWAELADKEETSHRELWLSAELAVAKADNERLHRELRAGVIYLEGTREVVAAEIRRRWQLKDAVIEAAQQILDAVEFNGPRVCPHGNGTGTLAGSWFCDNCFYALQEALIAEVEGKVP